MRILIIVNQLVAEQSQLWTAVERANVGGETHLAGGPGMTGLDAYQPSGQQPELCHLHELSPMRLRQNRDHLWWWFRGAADLVADVRPDLIHVNSEIWGLMVWQALHLHHVVVAHGADNQFDFGGPGFEAWLRRLAIRRNLARLAGYVSWNEAGAHLARVYGLPGNKALAVLPAMTAAPVDPVIPRRWREVKVGFIGRLVPVKGATVVYEAVRALVHANRPFSLHIVGDGPDRARLAATPWLNLLGPLGHLETLAELRGWTVLVVPSLTTESWIEQFGRVVVEAMAAGVPVITSDSGALPEVVGDRAYVVHENDASALAERLQNFEDVGYRERASAEASQRYREHYHPDVLAAKLMQVWRRALDAGR